MIEREPVSLRAWAALAFAFALAGVLLLGAGAAHAVVPGTNKGITFEQVVETEDGDDVREIRMVDPAGENERTLFTGIPNDFAIGRSLVPHPSGSAVALRSDPSEPRRWWLTDLDGDRIRDLSTDPLMDFSPDGSKTLTSVRTNPGLGISELALRDVETGAIEMLGFEGESLGGATFSPDGSRIVAVVQETHDSVQRPVIYGMNADGSGVTQLADAAREPSISPDGMKVAFRNVGPLRDEIWIMGIDGSGARKLAGAADAQLRDPSFSPDGKLIAYERFDGPDDEVEVWTMSPTGGGARRVVADAHYRPSGGGVPNYFPGWLRGQASLALAFDGFESGPDEATLGLVLANTSAEGAISNLTYPGGPSAGLIVNTNPYPPAQRGAVALRRGPLPTLPNSLAPSDHSSHLYVLDVTEQGNVMVRVQADGKGENGDAVSETTFVEVSASPYELDDTQKQAMFAGAYMELMEQIQAEADAEVRKAVKRLERMMRKFGGKKAKRDIKRDKPEEDLLAELYGLPAGSLDFLPDRVKNYLLWSEARSQGEWKAWKRKLGKGFKRGVRDPLEFWGNQVFGSDPTTKFEVGRELWNWTGEQGQGLQSFAGDASQMLEGEAWGEAWDGMPGLIDEYTSKAGRTISGAYKLGKGKAKKIAKQFKRSNRKGIKASAEWFADAEVEVADAVATEAVLSVGGGGLVALKRMRKAGKTTEAVQDIHPPRSTLDDLAPRTIDDGLVPPTAAQLGMPPADQKLIADVTGRLEQKAAQLGYPGLELETAFRSRGYSAPGAIGKNQYVSGKTGGEIDLLLGMNRKGLGNNAIFKPKLPKNLKNLPGEIQTLVKDRFDDQLKTFKQWRRAEKGKSSKLKELYKATGRKGNTFENVLEDGTVTDRTFMRLKTKKKGNTTILEYFDLNVNGHDIVKGKRTPIGSDYDGLYLGLKGGGTPPAGVRSALWLEANQLFTKLAKDRGFAWGFHGFSRDGFEFSAGAFQAKIWQYVAEGLPEADALRIFGNKPADVLDKMTFGQYAIKVTKEGATTGPINP